MKRVCPLATGAALLLSCSSKPELTFDVTLPQSVSAAAAWIEVGAYDGTCLANYQLGGGLPPAFARARAAFRAGGPGLALGNLPRGRYAFAAVARGEDCGVVATGCNVVDVSDVKSVAITMQPTESALGACAGGAVCRAARCVPSADLSDPSVGARCSLQLVGAGPLPNPLTIGSTVLSAPAVVTTTRGFVIAYREYDPAAGEARLTLLPVDTGGGARPAVQETLGGRCAGSDESDAAALAYAPDGETGVAVVSRPACASGGAGLNLFAVDAVGAVLRRGVEGFPGVRTLTLANAHALTVAPGGGFQLAVTRDGQASVANVLDVRLVGAGASFGGVPPMTGALIAASDKALGLVAVAPPTAADAGPGLGSARVNVVAAGTSPNALGTPTEVEASWASVAAQSTRVVVATDGASVGRPVALRLFDLGRREPQIEGFAPEGLGKVSFADVALRQDHLFLVVEQPGAITLVAYERATSAPTVLREVQLGKDPRVPSLARLRGGRLAVAASDTRVAVAWTTADRLTQNDVVGGYAVFACRTP